MTPRSRSSPPGSPLNKLIPRFGAKPLITIGMTLSGLAMYSFTRLSTDSSYAGHVLPGLITVGIGIGTIAGSCFGTATLGVDASQAGVASAMVNISQQIGGSVGAALLSTLFASAARNYTHSHVHAHNLAATAVVHGYTTAFWWAAGIFALGLVISLIILPTPGRDQTPSYEGRGEP